MKTITPWKPGDGGLLCLPLRSNIPESKNPDWRLVTCPRCGRACWESDLARLAMAAGASGVCTECAIRAGISHPGGGEKLNDRRDEHRSDRALKKQTQNIKGGSNNGKTESTKFY